MSNELRLTVINKRSEKKTISLHYTAYTYIRHTHTHTQIKPMEKNEN